MERPSIIRAIAEARSHGDLSENAEYHSAREKQSFIEGRIKELEGILSRAEVIDPSKLSGSIKFGARVTLVDEDTGEEKLFQLVGEQEADLERGLLNVRSPLARALIGRPKLLLLDELAGSMDAEGEAQVVALLAELRREGTSVVFTSHRPALVAAADRVLALRNGTLVPAGEELPRLLGAERRRVVPAQISGPAIRRGAAAA